MNTGAAMGVLIFVASHFLSFLSSVASFYVDMKTTANMLFYYGRSEGQKRTRLTGRRKCTPEDTGLCDGVNTR